MNGIKFYDHTIGKNFPPSGNVIDLGAGAADIAIKFALTYPSFKIDAVDGSKAMLIQAEKAIDKFDLNHRINLVHSSIQNVSLIEKEYEIILSNSLLHHLHDPTVLWQLVKRAKGLRTIFSTFVSALPALANIGALLGICLFLFAILGMNLFIFTKPQDNDGLTE